MDQRAILVRLGIGAMLAAVVLIFYAIPQWVSSPSNVRNIVLSPLFWPYILGGLTGLVGLGLVVAGRLMPAQAEPVNDGIEDPRAGLARLCAMAVLMALVFWALPRLGMVWTSMLAFVGLAFLMRTRHPVTALVCAVLVPLLLYGFFAHVAGVAIPQGTFVRLP